jgi:predicted  nucleic acid-binding Zn-ribbon protein
MPLICTVCGETYHHSGFWIADRCDTCHVLNFAEGLEGRLHDELAPARAALEAYVTAPVSARQRTALTRLAARWDEESRS